ncbi:hypothetical protein A2129_00300 [Candidatus Woesebacteria bacterium GWC1_42_13]|uniref:Uncharacterized protein n=2 Tax=Candidatus Woeseibacteriota TaxID=1752722 RepID=A0A1F7WVQ2_9BACT|nr:MAG: hypothetical protein A2112_00870 [Candidatus Woesebacteria bacterium GWA1_42_12]OGM06509.1 MAG: hypothetical protein A2129_00300 [Candidatus Woesebacteria bacterium GWC1_42_13]
MSEKPESGEKRPPTAEEVMKWQSQDLARRRRQTRHGTVFHEHLDLAQTEAEDRARKRAHPTSGSTTTLPVRTGFQGQRPPKPGE